MLQITIFPGQKVWMEAQDPAQEGRQVQGQGSAPEEEAAATTTATANHQER